MKALKHIAGILLATLGVVFLLGVASSMLIRDSGSIGWVAIAVMLVLGSALLAGAIVLLKRRATELPPTSCPKCGGTKHTAAGVLTRAERGWMFHLGGWLFVSLWGASRQQQVRCIRCDTLYFAETRGTRIAGICLWVFLLLLILDVIAGHVGRN